jgi:hypothetical protein
MLRPGLRWWWWSRLASRGAVAEWRPCHLPCTCHRGSPCTSVTASGPAKSPVRSPALSPFLGQHGVCLVATTALTASWDALTLSHRSLGKLGFDSPMLPCLVLLNQYSLQALISDRRWRSNEDPLHTGRGGSSWTVMTLACEATSNFLGFLQQFFLGFLPSRGHHGLWRLQPAKQWAFF